MRRPRILMCPPDHYGIEYEINPWMSRSSGSCAGKRSGTVAEPPRDAARPGNVVELMTPQQGLPDLVFTANAGLIFRKRFFSSAFVTKSVPAKRRISTPGSRGMASRSRICRRRVFEGAGDALFCGRRSSPAIASAAMSAAINGWPGNSSAVLRSSWSIRPSIISTLASARWRRARRSGIPMLSTPTASKVIETHIPSCSRQQGRGAPFRLQCGRGGQDRRAERRLPRVGGRPERMRLHADRRGAGRIPQSRRQCQVPDLRLDGEEAAVWEQVV